MRFTIPAINNDYHDEDYLRVFGFPNMGKNIRVHRSVVFSKPNNVTIGDNVTISPYCVFGDGATTIEAGTMVPPFSYFAGTPEVAPIDAEKRIKELEDKLKAKDDAWVQAQKDAEKLKHVR